MGFIGKVAGTTAALGTTPVITASVVENYIKQMKKEGKNPADPGTIVSYFGKTGLDRVSKIISSIIGQFKNEGGMMHARKKNMGLKMADGGPVGSGLKPVPSGNKGLSKLPTPVRNKMGFKKQGGKVMKRKGGGMAYQLYGGSSKDFSDGNKFIQSFYDKGGK